MSRSGCSVCVHAEALAIDSALEAGVTQLSVAAQFQVSKYSLSRHRNKCLAVARTPETSNTAEALGTWMQRCEDTYLAACANSDIRSAVSALSAAVRSLQFSLKQEEKEREQAAKNDVLPNGEHPMTIESMDAAINSYMELRGDISCFSCGAPILQGSYLQPGTNHPTVSSET